MDKIHEFILSDLDLQHKHILDAATGAGKSLSIWAERVHEGGGTSEIISVDTFDIPGENEEEWKEEVRKNLGAYAQYVELQKADIFNLDFLENESINIINCHDTIIFLNPRPLKLLSALKEFKRVLKQRGQLIITSETPVKRTPENEGQWRRWNFAKAVYRLKGETWSTEPLLEEVKTTVELLGFNVYDERVFSERKIEKYGETMDEWERIMSEDIEELEWSKELKEALRDEVDRISWKVGEDGYLTYPRHYVLKCKKK